jgi:hypothetical protein
MPDRDVKTIRDLIYYQYAKIIAARFRCGATPWSSLRYEGCKRRGKLVAGGMGNG